jgi:hypothetical protein
MNSISYTAADTVRKGESNIALGPTTSQTLQNGLSLYTMDSTRGGILGVEVNLYRSLL